MHFTSLIIISVILSTALSLPVKDPVTPGPVRASSEPLPLSQDSTTAGVIRRNSAGPLRIPPEPLPDTWEEEFVQTQTKATASNNLPHYSFPSHFIAARQPPQRGRPGRRPQQGRPQQRYVPQREQQLKQTREKEERIAKAIGIRSDQRRSNQG
jgi:hypothetical protein